MSVLASWVAAPVVCMLAVYLSEAVPGEMPRHTIPDTRFRILQVPVQQIFQLGAVVEILDGLDMLLVYLWIQVMG